MARFFTYFHPMLKAIPCKKQLVNINIKTTPEIKSKLKLMAKKYGNGKITAYVLARCLTEPHESELRNYQGSQSGSTAKRIR